MSSFFWYMLDLSFLFLFFFKETSKTLNLNIFSSTYKSVWKRGTLQFAWVCVCVCVRIKRECVYETSWEKIWMHILECCWECLSLSRGWVKSTVTEIQSCASCHLCLSVCTEHTLVGIGPFSVQSRFVHIKILHTPSEYSTAYSDKNLLLKTVFKSIF